MSYRLFVPVLLISIWGYCKNCCNQYSYAHLFWRVNVRISPGYFLQVKLLNCKIGICLVDMTKQFSKLSMSICPPVWVYAISGFSEFLPTLDSVKIFLLILVGVYWCHIVVLICISWRLMKLTNYLSIYVYLKFLFIYF